MLASWSGRRLPRLHIGILGQTAASPLRESLRLLCMMLDRIPAVYAPTSYFYPPKLFSRSFKVELL